MSDEPNRPAPDSLSLLPSPAHCLLLSDQLPSGSLPTDQAPISDLISDNMSQIPLVQDIPLSNQQKQKIELARLLTGARME
ncbi:hypothetical protein CDV36_007682 [Fusarium kuroshium]|uniref:Uncharacterized protein n=1 Tax=Fusarium kuroshium TaxID=2010991 RepID=A0A3M2S518_9HYPO|nr:hypothetical protein CDV36_007682 [Fusarium kuroshium]